MRAWQRVTFSVALAIAASLAADIAAAATFTIRSTDAAGEGLNDPTPFAPIGGNNATTLGAARMNVLTEAARVWGALIQSNVPILVDAAFDSMACGPTSGTLGSAGPRALFRDFGAAVPADVLYVSALADSLAGRNISSQPTRADITATFNSALDSDPACLGGSGFYYGLDHNRNGRTDLLLVVLHELSHGLGFSSEVSLTSGAGTIGSSGEHFSSYVHQVFDETLNRAWPTLTATERLASAARTGSLAWNGSNTNAQLNRFTRGGTVNGRLRLNAPATISTGSSVSHWDPIVSPSALMEPNLPGSITSSTVDITTCALQDIGWQVTQCPHNPNNVAPIAAGQSVTTAEDTPISVTLTATDVDGNPLTYAIANNPTAGTLSSVDNSTHTVTYTPNLNSNSHDSFAFTANDGAAVSAPALVSITITPINDAPTASALSVSVAPGQSIGIVLLGSDADGDAITYSVLTNPASGTLSGTTPTLTYRGNDGFVGTDSFTYRVNDGTVNSATAIVTLSVSTPPPASSGGGGGAIGLAMLWLLAATAWLRRLTR